MDAETSGIVTAVLYAMAIFFTLEAINPHRKPESPLRPVTAAVVWAVVLAAISVLH